MILDDLEKRLKYVCVCGKSSEVCSPVYVDPLATFMNIIFLHFYGVYLNH